MTQYEFHPLANIFPLLEGEEFDALVEDIRRHGLIEPIVVLNDRILDGRNRFRACQAAGVDCTFIPYRGDDPVAYIISLNLKRRHLDESQRATVAARLANMRQGERTDLPSANLQKVDRATAAEMLNVSERSVANAAKVLAGGVRELIGAVERGDISVSAAADVATCPANEQREIVARGEKEILQAAKAIRAGRAGTRRTERLQKLVEISSGNSELSTTRRYPVIYADPPWHFEVYNELSGVERAAGNHYPTMSLDDICALPVQELTTCSAVLFLWTTAPHLQEAFKVIAAWGFLYKTNVVWTKDRVGLGYYVRNQHELLLIATRGNIPSPPESQRPPSVISAPRREHSRKPDEAYELIEQMYPELPKIELFARTCRQGWDSWGNQAEGDGLDIPPFLLRVAS